mmetsp:Transcript_7877/g.18641  ORF Transcript_7877/g.18641 Transcript_7877/m.18641 type:complete len:287 (+) Transcript_7877:118-978(+)|eukprot:CAMPEP_0185811328 /NCGR_PEP_ID=MMETSP1322-20130828/7936_1 /TAXON_ID=265543 /ORGANISM="Minutocellus polymorphus, Strain RCC2270" /LENGTH=286 /DNA_ID=CAMNT_0028507755 /DNA_START=45 /DNA_END=905 /DNA_ORIENTATION=+
MASTAPQDDKGMSAVSKKWDADNKGFLTDEERALRNLDTEGTGTLTAKQLSSFADQYAALRKENEQIKRGLAGLALLAVLLFVGTVVASVVAAQASRDTATNPETGVMMASGSNSPVSVNANELNLPLAALPFLPPDVAAHVKSFSVIGPTGENFQLHLTVGSILVVNSTRLVVTATTGDKVTWPSADGDGGEITVSLADGTSWNKPAECTNCVATNVLATEENERGFEAFLDQIGWECPYASNEMSESGETGTRRLKGACPLCDIDNGGLHSPPGGASIVLNLVV